MCALARDTQFFGDVGDASATTATATSSSPQSQQTPFGGMDDLMNGFGGLSFGAQGSGEPLPAAMQLQQQQRGGGQQQQQQQQSSGKQEDDLLGLL